MVKSTCEQAQRGSKWTAEKRTVTPGAQVLNEEQHLKMVNYVVTKSSAYVAAVARVGQDPPFHYRVNLTLNRCTCAYMDQFGVPCRHMLATLANFGDMWSVFCPFAACYKVTNYVSAFGSVAVELPAGNELIRTPLLPAKRKLHSLRVQCDNVGVLENADVYASTRSYVLVVEYAIKLKLSVS